jgi:hypothetical protein
LKKPGCFVSETRLLLPNLHTPPQVRRRHSLADALSLWLWLWPPL